MVLNYVKNTLDTAWQDTKDGVSNAAESLATGNSPGIDLERRHTLELLGAGAATYFAGSNHVIGESADWMGDQVPDVQWQVGPFGSIDKKNDVDTEKTPVSTSTPTDTGTDEDIAWVESYDVESFTEDLYAQNAQNDFSVDATNDFLETAYSRAGGEINEVGITEDGYFKVNDIGASLYGENPGLGYSEEFGETLKVLDNEEKLDDIVEDYVEQELV